MVSLTEELKDVFRFGITLEVAMLITNGLTLTVPLTLSLMNISTVLVNYTPQLQV